MTIKIALPNPQDMKIQDWFSQMELALYHAKKSYGKYIENMEEAQIQDVSIYLSLPRLDPYMEDLNNGKGYEKVKELSWDDYYDASQEIEIVISY